MTITDADRILRIVGDLDRFLMGVLDPILKEDGLGREHWQVLRLLADGHGHPMGRVSEAVGLSGATATRVVDSLTEKMLAYRRNDPLDRRRVLVYLSEPGQEALSRVQHAFREHAASALAGLEPGERRNFVALLDKFVPVTGTACDGVAES